MILTKFLENIGDSVINYSIRTYDFLIFFFKCIGLIFLPSSYTKTSIEYLIKQIYLNSIKYIFYFIFSALFLGSIFIVIAVSFAINFSLQDQIGNILVSFVINEFSPFFTTVFFILTYTLSSHEKIQNIKRNMKNMITEIYIPKLLSILLMIPLMALLFATIMMLSGYIVSSFYLNIDFLTYKNLIVSAIGFENILILFFKSFLFAFVSIFVPIYYGHKKEREEFDITELIIKILIIIISMLLLIELLAILIVY